MDYGREVNGTERNAEQFLLRAVESSGAAFAMVQK